MGIIKGLNLIKVDGGSGPIDPEEPTINSMKFAITYNASPLSISLGRPKLKYNKKAYFSVHADDAGWRWGDPLIGFLNGLTYTDGCGNNKSYTSTVAINTGTGNPGDEFYNPNFIQEPEFRQFINADYDIMNHGNIHNPIPSAIVDTNKLDDRITQRINYKMRGTIIPANHMGYANAASLIDYKCVISQGDYFDQFNPPIRWHELMTEPILSTLNQEFVVACMVRDFQDEWEASNSSWHSYFKQQVDRMYTPSRDFFMVGTHTSFPTTAAFNGWKSLMQYVKDTSNDRLLCCSPREFIEYLEMRLMPMSVQVSGNQLIVTINITNLSNKNRWKDLSFISSGNQNIVDVTAIEGIDSVSFNPSTRLINIFKQKKVWN